MQVVMQACWVSGGIVGALLGTLLPASLKGLEFPLVGLFVVLAIDACRAGRDVSGGLLAVACALVAAAVAPDHMLLVAMGLFVLVLAITSRADAPPEASRA
jgi:predicted branched-subunit amino acid permease